LHNELKEVKPRKADVGFIYGIRNEQLIPIIVNELKTKLNGRKMVFFTIHQVNLNERQVYGIWSDGEKQEHCYTNLPTYIYNYVLHRRVSSVSMMRELRTMEDIEVINPINSFHQDMIFDMLSSSETLISSLLPYSLFSEKVLLSWLEDKATVYVYPQRTQRYQRAICIQREDCAHKRYLVVMGEKKLVINREDISYEVRKLVREKKHMMTKSVTPVNWNNSPLEMRIYVQKGAQGVWQALGSIGKKELFSQNSILDRCSDDLERVLFDMMPDHCTRTCQQLKLLALDMSTYLDFFIPNLGSLYFDFILSEAGKPYLVAMGGFDQTDFLMKPELHKYTHSYYENTLDYLNFRLLAKEQGDHS
jgi:hypothetical protein